jgi:cyclophilin family peptidyl-prolyl cis-trans isomerase
MKLETSEMKRMKSIRNATRTTIDQLEQRMMLSATVTQQIPSTTLHVGGTTQSLSLGNYFDDSSIPSGDTVIEIQTNLPSPYNLIPMELTTAATPDTVANFLAYISNGDYANTIIHRSIPGFVIQGGGYKNTGTMITPIGTIDGESSTETLKNTTGTIAMALSTGPNSATSEWFFNLADNPELDNTSDGGPFTVFGQVIYQGLSVLNYIAGLPVVDDTGQGNGAWNTVPVISGTNGATVSTEAASNLVTTTPVDIPTGLVYTVNSSNTSVVTTSVSEGNLTLNPVGAGTATISVTGEDLGLGTVSQSFTVTVDAAAPKPVVYVANAAGTVGTNNQVTFPITLSNASSSAITLNYTLTAGTASSSDYQATASSLTIPAGATTASIPVNIVKDSLGRSETFTLTLSTLSSNAVFGSNTTTESATGIINPTGTVSTVLTVGGSSGTVGTNSQVVFPVTLSEANTAATTFDYTLVPGSAPSSDFTATGNTITIPAGTTTASIPVTLVKDSTGAPETFTLTLTNLSSNAVFTNDLSSEAATGLIDPSGTVSTAVSISDASGTVGNDSQIVFPVTLTTASTSDTTLDYTITADTAGSSDFSVTGTSLTIPAGSTTASIPVTLVGDTTGAAETFTITLSNLSANAIFANAAATESATGTINPAVVVGPATTTTTLTSSAAVVAVNGGVTLTATVATIGAGGTPTGTITFQNGGVAIGTATLADGAATMVVTLPTPGDASFTAVYSGDSSNLTSTSNTLTVNAATVPPVISKSTLPTTAVAGQPVKGTTVVSLTNDTVAAEKGKVTVNLYASTDGSIDSSAVLVATVTKSVNIKIGKSISVPLTVRSFPSTLASGSYTLLSQTINTAGQISNAATGPALQLAAPVVTLSESFTKLVLPASVVAGSKTSAAAVLKITNSGNVASSGATIISLYASTDGTVANGTLIKTVTRKLTIQPGKSVNVSVPLGKYPSVTNGTYTIVAQVTDPKANISQHAFATPVTIAAAMLELSVASVSVPATGILGKGITVTVDVTNAGNITAAGSLDINLGASTLSTGVNPFSLSTLTAFINIKPGGKQVLHLKVPIALGSPSGEQFIVATLTSDNVFGSTDFTNPAAVSATTVNLT